MTRTSCAPFVAAESLTVSSSHVSIPVARPVFKHTCKTSKSFRSNIITYLFLASDALSAIKRSKNCYDAMEHKQNQRGNRYNHITEENTGIAFDSYMIADNSLEPGFLRLLEVDNRVVLPVNTHIRVLITAADVLHSWAIPSFGVKVDACPGRLNQTTLFIKKAGVFYGQCSELCGTNHGFMPICVEAVELDDYVVWLEKNLNN